MKASFIASVVAILLAGTALGLVLTHSNVLPPIGATSVQVLDGDCILNGGFHHCSSRVGLRTATSTPAAIKAPTAATSTLSSVQLQLNVASSSATYWDIGVASTCYATTTVVATYTVAANATAFIQGSTSPAALAKTVIPPGYCVVVKNAGGITAGDTAGTGFIPSGALSVQFDY